MGAVAGWSLRNLGGGGGEERRSLRLVIALALFVLMRCRCSSVRGGSRGRVGFGGLGGVGSCVCDWGVVRERVGSTV